MLPLARAATAFLVAAPLWAAPSASGDCVGPNITIHPTALEPGDDLEVSGDAWGDACDEVDHTSGRCSSGPPTLGDPQEDIGLFLRSAGRPVRIPLDRVDASPTYEFDVAVRIPRVDPGLYEVVARSEESRDRAELRILRNVSGR